MSRTDLVQHVAKAQEQPFIWQIDIDGLTIHASVKQLIINCYEAKMPFGLATDDLQNVVYFLPENECAVWCDKDDVTLNTFKTIQQFQDCIKLALVAHRKFLSSKQLAGDDRYVAIVEQIKELE